MAPSPEYDKEPKAPDKAVVNISSDDSKVLYNHTNEYSSASDVRSSVAAQNNDVENKHVESLDDGQLRALLDEAITYKCPKDREGKSNLFKELLEEVEQDEEACEAAARAGRAGRRDHHSSLQDLVAAMAAEPAPRRRHHQSHNVSARAHHGGSLPSGVDTSFLLSEEPSRGGYLATVRCVNPPPLAERRVSASDANAPPDIELVTRRSKPMFPMTYTARATLEIGSGSVGSGRAVTTTTASNQVRTTTLRFSSTRDLPTAGPPHRHCSRHLYDPYASQNKLMKALCTREQFPCDSGGNVPTGNIEASGGKEPRGFNTERTQRDTDDIKWNHRVEKWYESLDSYARLQPFEHLEGHCAMSSKDILCKNALNAKEQNTFECNTRLMAVNNPNRNIININQDNKNRDLNNYSENIPRNELDDKNRVFHVSDHDESDISLRKLYRVSSGLVAPNYAQIINPKNIRNMTIGKPFEDLNENHTSKNVNITSKCSPITETSEKSPKVSYQKRKSIEKQFDVDKKYNLMQKSEIIITTNETNSCTYLERKTDTVVKENEQKIERQNKSKGENSSYASNTYAPNNTYSISPQLIKEKEKVNLTNCESKSRNETNSVYVDQLFEKYVIEGNDDIAPYGHDLEAALKRSTEDTINFEWSKHNTSNEIVSLKQMNGGLLELHRSNAEGQNMLFKLMKNFEMSGNKPVQETFVKGKEVSYLTLQDDLMTQLGSECDSPFDIADLRKNACVLLTIPDGLLKFVYYIVNNHPAKINEIGNIKNHNKSKMKSEKPGPNNSIIFKKNILKYLLYSDFSSNSVKDQSSETANNIKEIDSAIPFSCITTPEVVASCNTTSTTQSAVVVDTKPLQLESSYSAVASLTSSAPPPAAATPALPAPHALQLARNVLTTTTFSGLPLARPTYGSTACSSADEYKKSLDENGNAVHGFSSPISGSSQHKKPRRKKSSKNETVIKSHQIDGYQGNKDLNEVLRFIESNAEGARGPKVRPKHKDDSEDKGKKRCSDRRKDKENKVKRASSLEERSRTKLEDLTDKPATHRWPAAPPAKPERRSWGDDARAALLLPDDVELTDFQTVTKRRKPRRRLDEHEPARPPPSPEPRARRASPSERSNDSNDDLDSVHSLPPDAPHTRPKPAPLLNTPPPPPPPPLPVQPATHTPASYADIARTRNNIPDLIESCNFYAEGDEPKEPPAPDPKDAAPAAESMNGYPALTARRAREKATGGMGRPQRKERAEARSAEPAPDVVADRRPAVILVAAAARGRDMDGVTFGFDINEQLLSGGGRRARCDLLEGVPVRAGCAALRYVPPATCPNTTYTHQIIDYVGTAWEDIIQSSSGKVRYYSE